MVSKRRLLVVAAGNKAGERDAGRGLLQRRDERIQVSGLCFYDDFDVTALGHINPISGHRPTLVSVYYIEIPDDVKDRREAGLSGIGGR